MSNQIKELIKYGFWGLVSTGINLVLFFIFIQFGVPYLISNIVSFAIAVFFSYIFNRLFVFKSKTDNKTYQQFKFYLIRSVSIIVDSSLLVFFHETIKLELMLSKILVSGFIIGTTYIINKVWIFNN